MISPVTTNQRHTHTHTSTREHTDDRGPMADHGKNVFYIVDQPEMMDHHKSVSGRCDYQTPHTQTHIDICRRVVVVVRALTTTSDPTIKCIAAQPYASSRIINEIDNHFPAIAFANGTNKMHFIILNVVWPWPPVYLHLQN